MPHFDDQAAQLNMRYSKDPDFAPPTRWTRHAVLRQQERALHRSKRSGLRERQVEKGDLQGWLGQELGGDGCERAGEKGAASIVQSAKERSQERSQREREK